MKIFKNFKTRKQLKRKNAELEEQLDISRNIGNDFVKRNQCTVATMKALTQVPRYIFEDDPTIIDYVKRQNCDKIVRELMESDHVFHIIRDSHLADSITIETKLQVLKIEGDNK